jgi:hypothetical protein
VRGINFMENFIVTVLFIGIIIKQWPYIRNLKVPAKKSVFEIVWFVVGIFGFVLLTLYSTKEYIHYLIGVFGIIAFIFIWIKPGITDTGMMINVRGQKVYSWTEMKKVEISKTDYLKVTYFKKSGEKIVDQRFQIKNYDKIVSILKKNKIKVINI